MPMASSDRSGARLVRSALSALRVDSAQVVGALAHFRDEPGALSPLLDRRVFDALAPQAVTGVETLECFFAGWYGVGAVVFTRQRSGAGSAWSPSATPPLSSSAPVEVGEPSPTVSQQWRRYRARVRDIELAAVAARRPFRPVQIDVSVEEFLIELPAEAGPAAAARIPTFAAVASMVATCVRDAGHRLTYIHCPASPPAHRDEWRTAEGTCLRFGVAVPRLAVDARLSFGTALLDDCAALGVGLWVGARSDPDGTYDYWRPLLAPAPEPDGMYPALEDRQRLLVTCVGPAQPGTTAAVLSAVDDAGLPLWALSETIVDDLAIINLLTDRPPGGADVDKGVPAPAGFRRAFGMGADAGAAGPGRGSSAWTRVMQDFRLMATPYSPMTGVQRSTRQALWLGWSTPASPEALALTVSTMRAALDAVLADNDGATVTRPSIDYLICREVSADRLRGRAKVSLDLDLVAAATGRNGDLSWLGAFCSEVERRWRAELPFVLGTPQVDLDVVWRESWIGGWSGPPTFEVR